MILLRNHGLTKDKKNYQSKNIIIGIMNKKHKDNQRISEIEASSGTITQLKKLIYSIKMEI